MTELAVEAGKEPIIEYLLPFTFSNLTFTIAFQGGYYLHFQKEKEKKKTPWSLKKVKKTYQGSHRYFLQKLGTKTKMPNPLILLL